MSPCSLIWQTREYRLKSEFPDGNAYMQFNFMGTWPKGTALFMACPMMDRSFIGGLQFLNTIVGQSWARTPEWMQAYQTTLSAPKIDATLIRAALGVITNDVSLIPVCEAGGGRADASYVVADIGQRSFSPFYNVEGWWLNK